MNRYLVAETPDQTSWGILDRDLVAYCTLPDSDGPHPNLLPLEFRTKEAAQEWLNRCFVAWANGKVPAPDRWQPLRPVPSPWAKPGR